MGRRTGCFIEKADGGEELEIIDVRTTGDEGVRIEGFDIRFRTDVEGLEIITFRHNYLSKKQ